MINNSFFKNNEQIEIENLNILNYDLDYIKDHLNKYKKIKINLLNFIKLINKIIDEDIKLNKNCLNNNIDKIYIEYLNKYKIMNN